MKRLTLNEACLLEVSGELGESARQRLHAYFDRHPEARGHYEQIRRQYDLLRSVPRVELGEKARSKIAGHLKNRIQLKVRELRREELAGRRWRLIYQSLAGISAAAAAVIIVAGLWVISSSIRERREQEQVLAVDGAVRSIQSFNRRGDFDYAVADLNESIDEYQSETSTAAAKDNMHNLMSTLGTLASEREEIMPPPEPGSL